MVLGPVNVREATRPLWRGDSSPFGGEAVAKPACVEYLKECWGPLRDPTGMNPLATGKPLSFDTELRTLAN